MTEHPIIFSCEMICAILDGRKTQTRRVIKPQPRSLINGWPTTPDKSKRSFRVNALAVTTGGAGIGYGNRSTQVFPSKMMNCPYGIPGDILWVRENYRIPIYWDDCPPPKGAWVENCTNVPVLYETTGEVHGGDLDNGIPTFGKLRPSIHMPRWASRITLVITDVRVEMVQDISEGDAKAEGVEPIMHDTGSFEPCGASCPEVPCYGEAFVALWDSINAKRGYSWQSNPWVWVVEFKEL